MEDARAEPRQIRLKRLSMRSMRRGIKEMDLILMRFAAAHLGAMAPGELDAYEALLHENDHDLYRWISGQAAPPAPLKHIVERIAATLPEGA